MEESGTALALSASKMPFINVGSMLLVMFITHLGTLIFDLIKTPRNKRNSPIFQMFTSYGRVFVLHFVILGGAYVLSEYASVLAVILMFGVLKLAFEIAAYFLAHRFIDEDAKRRAAN
jgi:hypothetical protein